MYTHVPTAEMKMENIPNAPEFSLMPPPSHYPTPITVLTSTSIEELWVILYLYKWSHTVYISCVWLLSLNTV